MLLLFLKLTLSPILVALASRAARKWGSSVGGWIAGFPIVAGPVLFFYAWEQGVAFAAVAAANTLIGISSLCLFAIVYAHTARPLSWPTSLLLGYTVFAVGTYVLRGVVLPLWAASMVGFGSLALTLFLLPLPAATHAGLLPFKWDIPVRMISTAAIVLTLTGLAAWLGPRLSGLLTPFPVATTVLVAFAHHQEGGDSAIRVLRGLIGALFGFAAFCTVLGAGLADWGLLPAFGVALAVAGLFQTISLVLMRRRAAHGLHNRDARVGVVGK